MKKNYKTLLLDRYILSEHSEEVREILKKHKIEFNLVNIVPLTGGIGHTAVMFDDFYKGFYNFDLYIWVQDFPLVKEILQETDRKLAYKFSGKIFDSFETCELKVIASSPHEWFFFFSELAKIQIKKRKELDILNQIELDYAANFNSMVSLCNENIFLIRQGFARALLFAMFSPFLSMILHFFLHLADSSVDQ
ncbi:MAG: hypothetical protein RLZZ628_3656 [Bacteroidota bacterium]|jgi:hypothetical protein